MTHTETSLCFVFVIFNNDFFTLYVLNPIIQHAGAGQTARIRSLLQHTILGPTAAFNSTRDFATGRSFVCGDGSCIDCHKCHTYICHVVTCIIVGSPSPACLVYRTLASCGSRHGVGPRSDAGISFMKKYFKDVSREFDEFRVKSHICKLADCVVGPSNILVWTIWVSFYWEGSYFSGLFTGRVKSRRSGRVGS